MGNNIIAQSNGFSLTLSETIRALINELDDIKDPDTDTNLIAKFKEIFNSLTRDVINLENELAALSPGSSTVIADILTQLQALHTTTNLNTYSIGDLQNDITNKQDLVENPINGHFVYTDGNGQGIDSGLSLSNEFSDPVHTAIPTQKSVYDLLTSITDPGQSDSYTVVLVRTNMTNTTAATYNDTDRTLTITTQAPLVVDGVVMKIDDVMVVTGMNPATSNGIYKVTNKGSVLFKPVLTRVSTAPESLGPSLVLVLEGTSRGGSLLYQKNVITAIDASDVVYTVIQSSTNSNYVTVNNNLSEFSASAITARANLGLGNVDNTSDSNKPVSGPTQLVLDTKQDITEKGQSNGYASLGADGKVPESQLPDITTETQTSLASKQDITEKDTANGYAALDSNRKLDIDYFPDDLSNAISTINGQSLSLAYTEGQVNSMVIQKGQDLYLLGKRGVSLNLIMSSTNIYLHYLGFRDSPPDNITKVLRVGAYNLCILADSKVYALGDGGTEIQGDPSGIYPFVNTLFSKVHPGTPESDMIVKDIWTPNYNLSFNMNNTLSFIIAKTEDNRYLRWGTWFTEPGIGTPTSNPNISELAIFNGLHVTFWLSTADFRAAVMFAWEVSEDGITPLPGGGRVWACGENDSGATGIGSNASIAEDWVQCIDSTTSQPITDCISVEAFYMIGSGNTSIMIRSKGGSNEGWFSGANNMNQGGNNTDSNTITFSPCLRGSETLSNIVKFKGHADGTYALLRDNTLYVAGLNEHGNLGLGDILPRTSFVLSRSNVADIFISKNHTSQVSFVRDIDGSCWAAGSGRNYRLGIGMITTEAPYPMYTRIPLPKGEWFTTIDIIAGTMGTDNVATGGFCGITNKNRFLLWGEVLSDPGSSSDMYLCPTPTEHPYFRS